MDTSKAEALLAQAQETCHTGYLRCGCAIHEAREQLAAHAPDILAWAIPATKALGAQREYTQHFEGCDTCQEKGICEENYRLLVEMDNAAQETLTGWPKLFGEEAHD